MNNNKIFYKQSLFWVIILIWLLLGYFISPTPSILSIILTPGNIITDLLIFPFLNTKFDPEKNFTSVHQFLYISHFVNFVYYIIIYSIYNFIKNRFR